MQNPNEELRMPFFSHLRELRQRMLVSIAAIAGGFGIAYAFSKPLFHVLKIPFDDAYREVLGRDPILITTGLVEGFLVYLKVGVLGGVFLASPIIFLQMWRFIAPGLKKNERRHVIPFVTLATVFFIGGALFGYFAVFPVGFPFFLRMTAGDAIEPMIRMREYYQMASWMMIVFGLVFEAPLLVLYLTFFGIIKPRHLVNSWRGVIVGIALGSALLTPADPISMILMAAPLLILYGVTILVSFIVGRKST